MSTYDSRLHLQSARAALDRQLDNLYMALGSGTSGTSTTAGLASMASQYLVHPFASAAGGGRISEAMHKTKVAMGYEEPTLGEKISGWTHGHGGGRSLADTAAGWAEAGSEAVFGHQRARNRGMWSRLKDTMGGG